MADETVAPVKASWAGSDVLKVALKNNPALFPKAEIQNVEPAAPVVPAAAVPSAAPVAEPVAAVAAAETPAVETPAVETPVVAEAAQPVVAQPAVETPAATDARDQRITELQAQLDEQLAAVQKFQKAENTKKTDAAIEDIKGTVAAIKEELGEDSVLFKALSKITDLLPNIRQDAEDARQVAAQATEVNTHQTAMEQAPLMKSVYNAGVKGDANAKAAWEEAEIISNGMLQNPKFASLPMEKFYQEVQRRLEAQMPELRKTYLTGPQPVAPRATLTVPAAKVTSPATLSDIPGGVSPQPVKPLDVTKLSPFDLAKFATSASRRDIEAIRTRR